MLFHNAGERLKLEIVNYELGPDGIAGSRADDRNWLVLRGMYTDADGLVVKDSNSCLLTYELRELAAGLKVLRAGIKDAYESDFVEPYFALQARGTAAEGFGVEVAFTLPNTMEDIDTAELRCTMTDAELRELIDELDAACAKFPPRD